MISPLRRAVAVAASAALLALPVAAISTQTADAAAKHYTSCAKLNVKYPHGVGKSGAKDHTSGTPVTNFTRSDTIYAANNGPRNKASGEYDLDRDNDGIACEKR